GLYVFQSRLTGSGVERGEKTCSRSPWLGTEPGGLHRGLRPSDVSESSFTLSSCDRC
ncbi:hypothetical protein XENOCAPTIV_008416, partial [Xenoophorus captivus]